MKKDKERIIEELGETRKELNFHRQSRSAEEVVEKERKRHIEEEEFLKNKVGNKKIEKQYLMSRAAIPLVNGD